jgi:ABC-type hemin transport system ATPase subunit
VPEPQAVIVATGRSAIGRANKGSLAEVRPEDLLGRVFEDVVGKSGIDAGEIDDIICGSVGGAQINIARSAQLLAGIPYTVPRGTWQCADGEWVAISTSAESVARRVLDLIHRLRDEGKAVIVISHAMDHVMEVADRAIVMRRGRKVGELVPSSSSREEIVSLIVGGDA